MTPDSDLLKVNLYFEPSWQSARLIWLAFFGVLLELADSASSLSEWRELLWNKNLTFFSSKWNYQQQLVIFTQTQKLNNKMFVSIHKRHIVPGSNSTMSFTHSFFQKFMYPPLKKANPQTSSQYNHASRVDVREWCRETILSSPRRPQVSLNHPSPIASCFFPIP